MESLGPRELREWLSRTDPGIFSTTLDTLEAIAIDGVGFTGLTQNELTDNRVVLGQAKRIMKIISSLSEHAPTLDPKAASVTVQPPKLSSKFCPQYNLIASTPGKPVERMVIDDCKDAASLDYGAPAAHKKTVNPYVNSADAATASSHIAAALPIPSVATQESIGKYSQLYSKHEQPRQECSQSVDEGPRCVEKVVENFSLSQVTQESVKKNEVKPKFEKAEESSQLRKSQRTPSLKATGTSCKKRKVPSGSSAGVKSVESATGGKRRRQSLAKSSSFTEISVSPGGFSRYGTVIGTLEHHPQGRLVHKAIARGSFTEKERRMLVKIVVRELIAYCGSHYPTHENKLGLAQAIVTEIPILKHTRGLGYEQYYDPSPRQKKGFIEFRLWNVRAGLPDDEKVYTTSTKDFFEPDTSGSEKEELSEVEVAKQKLLMRFANAKSAESQVAQKIERALILTFPSRRTWILTSHPLLRDVIREYPKIKGFGGKMVDLEFDQIYPGCGSNFITEFMTVFVPRILAYSKIADQKMYTEISTKYKDYDVCLVAMIMLMRLLPNPSVSKQTESENLLDDGASSTDETIGEEETPDPIISNLIEFVPAGKCLVNFMLDKRKNLRRSLQPYLICSMGPTRRYSIDADMEEFNRDMQDQFIPSFDLLFKLYHILDLEYPSELYKFYTFIACHVYKIEKREPSCVASLFVNISNINLQENAI